MVAFWAYLLAAILGLSVGYNGGEASPVWPASGVALWAMLRYGRQALPHIYAASVAANLWSTGGDPMAFGLALGSVAQSEIFYRFLHWAPLAYPRQALRACRVIAVGAAASALNGATWLAMGGAGWWPILFAVWTVGDYCGGMAGLLILFSDQAALKWSFEEALFWVISALIAWHVMRNPYPLVYAPLMLMIFGGWIWGETCLVFQTCAIIIASVDGSNSGPFAAFGELGLWLNQVYLAAAVTIGALCIADRRRAAKWL